jgi:hypothetical protein
MDLNGKTLYNAQVTCGFDHKAEDDTGKELFKFHMRNKGKPL